MIEIVKGDLVESINRLNAYATNCTGIYNTNLKLGLTYKDLQKNYEAYCDDHTETELIGKNLYTEMYPNTDFYAISMFVQSTPDSEFSYEALESCLVEIANYAKITGYRVAMPYGEAFGNCDWDIVSEKIYRLFSDIDTQLWRS